MKTVIQTKTGQSNKRGIALITVISVLALMTVFTIALFSISQTERSTSEQQYHQERARELADVAVNAVMGQIWQGAKQDPQEKTLWASQPGALRKYNADGSFHSGYKLYSSSNMVVSRAMGEKTMVQDSAPANWNTLPARYVDLNEPVVRPPTNGGLASVYFPVIDPRAYVRTQEGRANSPNVEGFTYDLSNTAGAVISGIVDAKNPDDVAARLPMPVEWMYVLQDGTLGSLSPTNDFIKPDGSALTATEAATNPIVGRLAFWGDDESCKLNINTASEPTYWTTPSLYHDRDLSWAFYQPTSYEYQRYPGHPATVALSSVFFPGQDMDVYGKLPSSQQYKDIIARKESIYALAPKVTMGGSKAGTEAYWKFADNYKGYQSSLYKKSVDLTAAIKERLYASVDELFYAQPLTANKRTVNSYYDSSDAPTANPLFAMPGEAYTKDKIALDKLRFFLTAHSRMPEVNMFGTPRVAIWPVADENGIEYTPGKKTSGSKTGDYRTGYDQLIAFCSSMGKTATANGDKSYFFRRKCAYDSTTDVNIPRNRELLDYLAKLLEQKLPGGASFKAKYPDDYKQILVEIFDYIRCTNLYDGFLCPDKETLQQKGSAYDLNNSSKYGNGPCEISADGNLYRNRPTTFKTYTYDRASLDTTRGGSSQSKNERQIEGNFPGHGMVVPTVWDGKYQGFGRFTTLSEVGFQFICTADGDLDKGSYRTPVPNPGGPSPWKKGDVVSGGRTALKIVRHTGGGSGTGRAAKVKDNFLGTDETQFWYSNYPPYPTPETMKDVYGVDVNAAADKANSPYNHPGCKPANWNATLDPGSPLPQGKRRVQGMLVMEFSIIAAGMTELNPEFSVEIEGLNVMKLNGNALYDGVSDSKVVWKSGQDVYSATDCRPTGGCISMAAMAAGRRIGAHGQAKASADYGYDTSANAGGDPHRGTRNFDLTTRFVTVASAGGTMQFTGGPLTVKVYSSHVINDKNLVQVETITMPSRRIPVPDLVIMSADHERSVDPNNGGVTEEEAVDAPHWWAFNYCGALNRFSGSWNGARTPWALVGLQSSYTSGLAISTNGRFFQNGGNDRTSWGNVPRGASVVFAYDQLNGNFSNSLLNPTSPAADNPGDLNSDTGVSDTKPLNGSVRDCRGQDVIFTMVPRHGDVRLFAGKLPTDAPDPNDWVEHPRSKFLGAVVTPNSGSVAYKQYMAHNLSRYYSDREAGYDRGVAVQRLVPNAAYNGARIPDIQAEVNAITAASKYGDFDNAGHGSGLRDGAYINKPDEGDAAITFHYAGPNNEQTVRLPNAYLATWDYGWLFSTPGESFVTPNRLIPSAGMFGSLPVGVKSKTPWRTLLFRPNTRPSTLAQGVTDHPGAAAWQHGTTGMPADHFIMDLFWMPVVEPYAISEPFSTAGKVNINYQIVPFTNIRRATGMHAVLKGEMLKAVPTADAPNYLNMPGSTKDIHTTDDYTYRQPWTDITANQVGSSALKAWHRNIEVEKRVSGKVLGTLQQFENRFNFVADTEVSPAVTHGLFRTASQICEIHLIPKKVSSGDSGSNDTNPSGLPYTVQEMSSDFYAKRRMNGDNTKERPYANIYAKITTQSNTFRVHYRSQVIRKARSSNATQFDPAKDAVVTDFRGSSLIERRIDPTDTRIPDYAKLASPANLSVKPLDDFYQFRVLEVKRFMP